MKNDSYKATGFDFEFATAANQFSHVVCEHWEGSKVIDKRIVNLK